MSVKNKSTQTNEELVSDLMNFSPVGALCQAFIIEAIMNYSNIVLNIDDESPEWENSFISLKGWKKQAEHCIQQIEERNNKFQRMKLKDLCEVKMNMSDADFWITRRGDKKSVGKPTKDFNSENIGIKVTSTEIMNADYLFYMMMYMHNLGVWQEKSNGTLSLVNIKIEDVKSIQVK